MIARARRSHPELPHRWIICDACRGEGRRDHPAFSNGITSSEWEEWDQDDRENYMRGAYDVGCNDCGGSGKIAVPDIGRCTFAQKRELVLERRALEREAREDSAGERYLRMMENGGYCS